MNNNDKNILCEKVKIERYIFLKILLEYFEEYYCQERKEMKKETHPIFDRFLVVRYHRKSIGAFHAIVVVDKTILQREIYIFDSFF